MVIALNICGEGNSINQGIDVDIEYNISQIKQFIYTFKPKSALELIDNLTARLTRDGKTIPPELSYWHGISLLEIGNQPDVAFGHLVTAYESSSNNINVTTQEGKKNYKKKKKTSKFAG